jgi:multicomponent Na+:H+ antiporter subunit D
MCTIIFVAFNYYKYGWGNIYQIFHYKIYNFEFISFSIDQYSIIYLLLLSILWPISILYTNSYLKNISIESQENNNHSKFLFFINLCIISASFIAISGNLITMFGFYEVLSLSTIPLIIYNNSAISYKALYKYFKLLFIPSTLFFLLAIFLVYSYSHNISFVNDEGVFRVFKMNDLNILLILLLFILGISKIATFPFFSWLPASMVALHPVSAILHAVAVVNSGIFCLLKIIIYIFGIDYLSNIVILQYLMIIPIIVIIYASIVACYQSNIKQILAYSTITQMNIMLAGLLSFKMIGILGVLVHMISHSLAKLLLFFQAGDIYIFTKSNELKDLKGLSRKMPITYIIIFIGILVLSGIPFFPNFFSKKQIIHSIINSQIYSYQYFSYIIKATGFIGCVYLLRIICAMMGKNSNMITYHSSRIYSLPSYLLLILITIISIELSFYPDTVINHLNDLLIYCTIFILIFIILYKFNIEQMGRIKTPQFINSVILILKRFDRFFALYILNYINKSFTTIGNPSSLNSSLYALLGLFIIFSINILFLG